VRFSQSSSDGRSETVVFLSAFSHVDSRLISLRRKTESPASSSSSTLFVAFFDGWDTLGVFLAGIPLVGAMLLYTRQWVS